MYKLPTFKVGQRVRIHNRPVEMVCPGCGAMGAVKEDYEGMIISWETNEVLSHQCGYAFDGVPEGWYRIRELDGTRSAAPYTLLTPIEEEQC